MRRRLLMDQFHVSIWVPPGLPASTYRSLRRTLDKSRFQAALHRAVREVVRRYPTLRQARFTWSQ